MNAAATMLLLSAVLVACGESTSEASAGTSPVTPPEQRSESPSPAFTLPEDPITISVHQRTKGAIPGSQATRYVRLGDVTGGQVMLSMENARGDTILDARSVKNGDVLEFDMGQVHYLQVVKLHNLLFDEDFVELRISATKPEPLASDRNPPPGKD